MAASTWALFSSFKVTEISISNPKKILQISGLNPNPPLKVSLPFRPCGGAGHKHKGARIFVSISTSESVVVRTGPDDLVASILSQVSQTDRGVSLASNEHKKVAEVAQELQRFCVDEPVNCPLIFGDWDVVYCSNPTSPGGGYRNAFGRLVFKTKEMVQVIEAPDIVRNRVSFSALGLDGEVSLKGKLTALDEKWIQVVFEPPELKLGGLQFNYGGKSEVKLEITYIDDKIRLGKGSRGSLFVFERRRPAS